MKKVKKGKIAYNQKTPPKTLAYNQVDMANKVAKEIIKIGYDVEIIYDSGTIDIVVIMDYDGIDSDTIKGLNVGIFRVFWSDNGDYRLRYLGVGIGHFDGYEIKRGWSPNLEITEVSSILNKDIEYYNKQKKIMETIHTRVYYTKKA